MEPTATKIHEREEVSSSAAAASSPRAPDGAAPADPEPGVSSADTTSSDQAEHKAHHKKEKSESKSASADHDKEAHTHKEKDASEANGEADNKHHEEGEHDKDDQQKHKKRDSDSKLPGPSSGEVVAPGAHESKTNSAQETNETPSDTSPVEEVDDSGTLSFVYSSADAAGREKTHQEDVVERKRVVFPNSDVYEGEWFQGKIHGVGRHTYAATKDVYEGEWRDGKKVGKGVYTFAAGNTYSGDWAADKRHGHGTYTTARGTYKGQWQHDQMHGYGESLNAHGIRTQCGLFEGGRLLSQVASFHGFCSVDDCYVHAPCSLHPTVSLGGTDPQKVPATGPSSSFTRTSSSASASHSTNPEVISVFSSTTIDKKPKDRDRESCFACFRFW